MFVFVSYCLVISTVQKQFITFISLKLQVRPGKTPSLREWANHLLWQEGGHFARHPTFIFTAYNMVQRHSILRIGNVVAQQEAADMTVKELKEALESGDKTVMSKLKLYSKNIPGSPAYYKSQLSNATAFTEHVRIRSDDQESFNLFLTFSMADWHWPDLHRHLPGSSEYLNKQVQVLILLLKFTFKQYFENKHYLGRSNILNHFFFIAGC